MISISLMVKQLREKLILSQTEFAELIGVTFSTVNRWENGRCQPPYKLRRRLAQMCEEHGIKLEDKGDHE